MVEWITNLISDAGLGGIVFLMFLENIFPPIPSELIMPFAGFVAAQGDLNIFMVILAGALGSILGAIPWYILGRLLSAERFRIFLAKYGRWLAFEPKDMDRTNRWFDRHGGKATFFGRLVPTVRTLISVPAGMSHMNLGWFFFFTAIGTTIWTSFLAGAGYFLESQYEDVSVWLDPVTYIVVAVIAIAYIYRFVTITRNRAREEKQAKADSETG